MYSLEVYKNLDKVRVITYSSLAEADKAAKVIMNKQLEEKNTYCMVWCGKSMMKYYD